MEVIERKIGRNRGKARLWVEGSALLNAGWVRGKSFVEVHVKDSAGRKSLEYRNPESIPGKGSIGKVRRVAGDSGRPIIDSNSDRLLDAMGVEVGDVVELSISENRIVVRKKEGGEG